MFLHGKQHLRSHRFGSSSRSAHLLSAITPKKQRKKGILRLARRTNPSKKRIKAKGRRKASLLKQRHTPRFPPSFFYVLPQSPPQKGNSFNSIILEKHHEFFFYYYCCPVSVPKIRIGVVVEFLGCVIGVHPTFRVIDCR